MYQVVEFIGPAFFLFFLFRCCRKLGGKLAKKVVGVLPYPPFLLPCGDGLRSILPSFPLPTDLQRKIAARAQHPGERVLYRVDCQNPFPLFLFLPPLSLVESRRTESLWITCGPLSFWHLQ